MTRQAADTQAQGSAKVERNDHADQSKAQTAETVLNDENALRKHRDQPDDPKRSRVDPEHDYADPSGKVDQDEASRTRK